MENKKTAQEILSWIKGLNYTGLNNLYKALLAYDLDVDLTQTTEAQLDRVLDFYYDTDTYTTFLNPELTIVANELIVSNDNE